MPDSSTYLFYSDPFKTYTCYRVDFSFVRTYYGHIWFTREAAIALVLGNIVNLYAAIGAIASLTLSVKEVSILAIMLCFATVF